jgi:hypothetical protein
VTLAVPVSGSFVSVLFADVAFSVGATVAFCVGEGLLAVVGFSSELLLSLSSSPSRLMDSFSMDFLT